MADGAQAGRGGDRGCRESPGPGPRRSGRSPARASLGDRRESSRPRRGNPCRAARRCHRLRRCVCRQGVSRAGEGGYRRFDQHPPQCRGRVPFQPGIQGRSPPRPLGWKTLRGTPPAHRRIATAARQGCRAGPVGRGRRGHVRAALVRGDETLGSGQAAGRCRCDDDPPGRPVHVHLPRWTRPTRSSQRCPKAGLRRCPRIARRQIHRDGLARLGSALAGGPGDRGGVGCPDASRQTRRQSVAAQDAPPPPDPRPDQPQRRSSRLDEGRHAGRHDRRQS